MSYAAIRGALNGMTAAKERIYRLVAPQDATLPYIVVQRIGGRPAEETFDGPTGLEPARFQIAYWTLDATTLTRAAQDIRAALASLGSPSFVENLGEDSEPEQPGGEAQAYASRIEVEIWGVEV